MNDICEDYRDVGVTLVKHAKDGAFHTRGVLTQLFPYVYQASKTMSARAISRWLNENRGVKISDVSISKALRNPDKHWESFAEFIEPMARRVEACVAAGLETFLYDERVFEHVIEKPIIFANSPDEAGDVRGEFEEAVIFLRERWFSLDQRIRDFCWRYFQPDPNHTEATGEN